MCEQFRVNLFRIYQLISIFRQQPEPTKEFQKLAQIQFLRIWVSQIDLNANIVERGMETETLQGKHNKVEALACKIFPGLRETEGT